MCLKLYPKKFMIRIQSMNDNSHSVISDSVTTWTVAHQVPRSMGFSRQEYWNGLLFSSPGDLPNPGIEPQSPVLRADSLPSGPPGKPVKVQLIYNLVLISAVQHSGTVIYIL